MPPRKKKPTAAQQRNTISDAALEKIREDIKAWEAGKWAAQNAYGPTCICTLHNAKEACPLHGQ